MSNATYYFVQGCPTCGRRLHVRVEYLGKKVVCDHCRGKFIARDPSNAPAEAGDPDSVLKRAEELLQSLDAQNLLRPSPYPR